jgi:hypothetical protein
MKHYILAVLVLGTGACTDNSGNALDYAEIGQKHFINIWVEAGRNTWDNKPIPASLNACFGAFEADTPPGNKIPGLHYDDLRCGERFVGDHQKDSVSIWSTSDDFVDYHKTVTCTRTNDNPPLNGIYDAKCLVEIEDAQPEELFSIVVNERGAMEVTMPRNPDPSRPTFGLDLPAEDTNVVLIDGSPGVTINWIPSIESTDIKWRIDGLDGSDGCKDIVWGLSGVTLDDGEHTIPIENFMVMKNLLPPQGCVVLLSVSRIATGNNLEGVSALLTARQTTEVDLRISPP